MQLLIYIQTFVLTHWTVILSYFSAGGGIAAALQFVKRLRKWESAAWIEFVLGTMTTVTAAANYIINHYTTSPLPTIFGNFAPKILLAAIVAHRLLVSPLSSLIEKKLVPWVTEFRMAIAELKAAKKASSAVNRTDSTNSFES